VTICPENADAVRADDELIERLRLGHPPPEHADPVWHLLAAWRDDVRRGAEESGGRVGAAS
jgi:hypothetical protein